MEKDKREKRVEGTSLDKKELRKEMQKRRRLLTQEEVRAASDACLKKIKTTREFLEAEWIYCYMSYQKEIETTEMISYFLQVGKRVAVPKVEGKEMSFYEITSFSDCSPGMYGILEPSGLSEKVESLGFMIVPGLAFDLCHNRMGYGGGYYDKYLAAHPQLVTAAVLYDFQILPEIPHACYDQKIQYLVTPERILGRKT